MPARSAFQRSVQPLRQTLRRINAAIARAKAVAPLEFEQIIIRYLVGMVITAYVAFSYAFEGLYERSGPTIGLLIGSAWVLGITFLVHISIWPHRVVGRRICSMLADSGGLSLLLAFGEKSAAVLFPVYLWVTVGNGFRFGISYLYGAIVANLTGFSVMAYFTPYWHEAWQFSAGLALAILIIPLYAAKLIRSLHQVKEQAEAASRAKTEFLSMMSHELRTPLTAIIGLANVSKLTAAGAKERYTAISTELAASRLLRMVDTILKFQRIESGAAEKADAPFDMLETLSEVTAIAGPLARQKGLDFHIRLQSGFPLRIVSDPDHVQTIILNLVTNAVKYTREGSVTLELGLEERGADYLLKVAVHDTGSGISPEAQSRIFERFVRAREHNSGEAGVGLGLATSKSLAELLGGELGFQSEVGVGSTFWAELPIDAEEAAGEPVMPPATPKLAPVLVLENAISGKVAERLGASSISASELLDELEGEWGRIQGTVLVSRPGALGEQLQGKLRHVLMREEPPLSLVLVGEAEGLESPLRFVAMADARGTPEEGLGELIGTVARWQRLNGHEFESEEAGGVAPQRPLSILLADDNALNRQVVGRMLELDGHRMVFAETGDEALEHLLDDEVDVAFLDVNMPGMSGIEVCRAYRTGLGSASNIPLLGLTADISVQTRRECLRAGMTDVLGKPVTLDQLRSALRQHAGGEEQDVRKEPDAPALPAAETVTAPVADRERIAALRELFGEEGFEQHFMASFERDLGSALRELRSVMGQNRPQAVREALHAVKSSASTAGAQQIIEEVDRFSQEAGESGLDAFEARIREGFEHYRDTVLDDDPKGLGDAEMVERAEVIPLEKGHAG